MLEKILQNIVFGLLVGAIIFVSACAINAKLECAEMKQNNADLRKSVSRLQERIGKIEVQLGKADLCKE